MPNLRLTHCPDCNGSLEPYGDDDRHDLWCDVCAIGFVKPGAPKFKIEEDD